MLSADPAGARRFAALRTQLDNLVSVASDVAPLEKTALDSTTIDSSSGTLTVNYSSSDSQFASLLTSPLFQSVVK